VFSKTHLALRLVHFGPSEKWVTEPNGIRFVFPKAGRGQYVCRRVTHRLSPGEVLILDPACAGELRADAGGGITFGHFSVRPEHLLLLVDTGQIRMLQNVCDGFKATKRYGADTALARECHRLLAEVSPEFNLEHRGQLLRVVAAVLGAEFRTAPHDRPGFDGAKDHLMQVLDNLPANELMALSVGGLAAKFGCGKRHLSRLFHQHFGFSMIAMKMEMRLLRATCLLQDPHAKIINVAEQCGFNNLGLFNTCFKKRFGVTPSQSRKAMANVEGGPADLLDPGLACPPRSKGLGARPDLRQLPNRLVAEIQQPPPMKLVITVKAVSGAKDGARVAGALKGLPIARRPGPLPPPV